MKEVERLVVVEVRVQVSAWAADVIYNASRNIGGVATRPAQSVKLAKPLAWNK